jgi:hypothetical protein
MNFIKALKLTEKNGRVFRPVTWKESGMALFVKKDGNIGVYISKQSQTKAVRLPTSAEFLGDFEMAEAPEIRIEQGKKDFSKLNFIGQFLTYLNVYRLLKRLKK